MPIVLLPTSTGNTALGTLVQRVRWLLEDYPMQDQMTVACVSSDTSITVATGSKWDIGAHIEWDDGTGDQALILGTSGTTLSPLRRSAFGTTAVDHAINTYLLRDPRFGYTQITQALTQVITAWFVGQVWVPTEVTLVPQTTGNFYYSVPADFIGWIKVTQLDTNSLGETDYATRGQGMPVKVMRGVDSALSSTGLALWIPRISNTTKNINLVYGVEVTTATVTEGPIAAAAVHGACALLVGAKDVPRTGSDVSQGDTTAQPGSTLRTAQWFQAQYQQYIRQARIDLINNGGRLHRD
jgi:hypothetical protein